VVFLNPTMRKTYVFSADVGAPARRAFAWAARALGEPPKATRSCSDIAKCATAIAYHLNQGESVSLGLECPLYVPLRDDPLELTNGRDQEGSPAWSSQIGATVLATGIVVAAWLLRDIRTKLQQSVRPFLNWMEFITADGVGFHLWEAKVSGLAKGTLQGRSHKRDARTALNYFMKNVSASGFGKVNQGPVLSLIGAVLVQTGWCSDNSVVGQSCIFLRPP
jgi:hypothetical protein